MTQRTATSESRRERLENGGNGLGRRPFLAGLAAGGAALVLGAPIVSGSHTPDHLTLRLDRNTTFTEMNRGYAKQREDSGEQGSDDYYATWTGYQLRRDDYNEADPYAVATTETAVVKDLRTRAWVGRRFKASGAKPTQVSFTVDGWATAGTDTGPKDKAVAIVRIRLYDHTTEELLRERLLREVRSEDGASDRQYGTYRRTFKPVLTPGHTYTLYVEAKARSARKRSYAGGNPKYLCEAYAIGEIKSITATPMSG